ncbi:MAG: DNA photolyase [Parachlamydiales bacterium]|nr:DNA photolyase [Parachlamydiales bacterium]
MIETVYIEEEIQSYPYVQKILEKITPKRIIHCDHYGEIFNRKAQNYSIQKQKPALILAKKPRHFIHETVEKRFGLPSYYFSMLYNCPFACSYCFLQGLYRSANYLFFINYEDFFQELDLFEKGYFYASHDSDALALDRYFHFVPLLIDYFKHHEKKIIELRTKSTDITPLIHREPLKNMIIAYSLNPQTIIQRYEHKTPSLDHRLSSLEKLQKRGWKISLCFDPMIMDPQWKDLYQDVFNKIFETIDPTQIFSATLGSLRFPKSYFKTILKKNRNIFLHSSLYEEKSVFRHPQEELILRITYEQLSRFVPKEIIEIQKGCG